MDNKARYNYVQPMRNAVETKDRFKAEGWKNMHHFNSNKGIKAEMAILTSVIVAFGAKNIIIYKERGAFHKNKGVTSLRGYNNANCLCI